MVVEQQRTAAFELLKARAFGQDRQQNSKAMLSLPRTMGRRNSRSREYDSRDSVSSLGSEDVMVLMSRQNETQYLTDSDDGEDGERQILCFR
mmetsp:Transcript_49099/g.81486  ORF Transcript_49099/g.81486 Transcript_49099/m.81486 type:complete len:92 (+) Transcript_49099:1-276(+)